MSGEKKAEVIGIPNHEGWSQERFVPVPPSGCDDPDSPVTTERGLCPRCGSVSPGPERAHISWGDAHFTCVRRVDVMTSEAAFAARALLINSFTDINFEYRELTSTEKSLVRPDQFFELVKWIHGRKS